MAEPSTPSSRTSKRFATIIPVTGYDKIEYVEVTMKASPRQSELNKYPTDRTFGYTPSKKAYCNNGSEDELYLAAPQKKLSKRQFAAKMFLYETDSESDDADNIDSESEEKKEE
eukprot:5153_1